MSNLLNKIILNSRAIGFALIVFILLESLAWLSTLRDINLFITITILGGIVFVVELLVSWHSAKKQKVNWKIPHLENRVWREHFTNHAILPFFTFVLTSLFIWNNNVPLFKHLFVILISLIFVPLFVNLHATYRNEMKLRKETHYIFDLVRIVIFFLVVDATLSTFSFSLEGIFMAVLVIIFTSFLLLFLMIWLAKQLSIETYLFVGLTALIVGSVYALILFVVALNPLTVAIITTITFFLMLTYWHHKLDGTFDFHVFSEYLLIVLLLLIILVGLGK